MKLNIKLILLLIFSVLFETGKAIDEKSARETKCLKITSAVDPDPDWVSSVKTWYYPLASRLDLYRVVHDLWKTSYDNIPESSVYYDSCLEWGIDSEGYTFNGFNGKTGRLFATPVGTGAARFKSDWAQGMFGTAYTTLTDNKTFMFTAACFDDDQMSWNVFSTQRVLTEATKKAIFEHAEKLGYNPHYFTELRYDSCRNDFNRTIDSEANLSDEVATCREVCNNYKSKPYSSIKNKYKKLLKKYKKHCNSHQNVNYK